MQLLLPCVLFVRAHDGSAIQELIGESLVAWHQMRHDLRKAVEAVDASKWRKLEARLLKREKGFKQVRAHMSVDAIDCAAARAEALKSTVRLAPFLTREMIVAYLLHPRYASLARQHQQLAPGSGVLNHAKLYQSSKAHVRAFCQHVLQTEEDRAVALVEFDDFQKGVGAFADSNYLQDVPVSVWWSTVPTSALHLVTQHASSVRPSNQAAEHGWGHLSRHCELTRSGLSLVTKRLLLNPQLNTEVLDPERAAERRTRQHATRPKLRGVSSRSPAGDAAAAAGEAQEKSDGVSTSSSSSSSACGESTADDARFRAQRKGTFRSRRICGCTR
jgi:hypothetical protein